MKSFMLLLAFAGAAMLALNIGDFTGVHIKGEGSVEKTARNVGNFTSIDANSTVNVYITQSPTFKVEVETQRNIADIFETVVEGNTLYLRFKKGSNNVSYEKLNVYISMPTLERLDCSGTAEVVTTGKFEGSKLIIESSGASDIKITEGVYNSLSVGISGSGKFEILGGVINSADVDVSGAGDVYMEKVPAQKLNAEISGAGSIKCNVSESIEAHISGAGNIEYFGKPIIKAKTSGAGTINPL